MKLSTVKINDSSMEGSERVCAVLEDNTLLDLPACAPQDEAFSSMLALIEHGDKALANIADMIANNRGDHRYGMSDVTFLAPLPVPNSIRDFANFELHCLQALETSMRTRAAGESDPEKAYQDYKRSGAYDLPKIWYERPYYFKGNRMTASGHESTIQWPRFTTTLDYELEFAAIIGKGGADIAIDSAADHIFGYTVYNDFSARDEQVRDQQFRMGPSKGKDFDTGNAFGPWIVTRDEIDDPTNLQMTSRINGETQGTSNSSGMRHNFNECIAFISRDETLYPGDILGSGTAGNGCGFETGRYLEAGDVIEIEIEKIGILRNYIGNRRS
ncbi:fumarylacetoacetate hydrolase family protein [Parasphingorhabdus cellanae]|uniref:Fumarylacetoacetate hydrolase family protein n=1 Tax=Parasphingorhabdus cellanae TaxID=2806553 RepID=A0ABX7T5P3_9SPHN|nr:fumarylacetoacetate hydrolase family protein [Parasphingorhabdus cellanae]QTD55832.1 fumarylacetoacetate hydrolase family protein [Parasphingorhabdus cellanae]